MPSSKVEGRDPVVEGYRVVVTSGPDRGRMVALEPGVNVIGRGRDCAVRLGDALVSRRHAIIRCHEDRLEVEDLGSSNGTRVNRRPVAKVVVSPGDTIEVGRTTMVLRAGHNVDPRGADVSEPTGLRRVALAGEPDPILWPADTGDTASILRAKEDLETLYRLGRTIGTTLDLRQLTPRLLDVLFEAMKRIDRCTILLRDQETDEMLCIASRSGPRVPFTHSMVYSRQMVQYVEREKRALLTVDASVDERFRNGDSIDAHGIRSAICAPLLGQSGVIGAIYADTVTIEHCLNEDDLRLLAAIGVQAGAAIENANLYDKVMRDVAALAEANQKIKATQDRLVQSEKLVVVGQLAAGIVHDVKNPMTVILGYARAMREDVAGMPIDEGLRSRMDEDLKEIENGVLHCNEVLNGLLQFARPSKLANELVDLNVVAQDTLRFVKHRLVKSTVQVELNLAPNLPHVQADAGQLRQVFMNLILNAIDAMEKPVRRLTLHSGVVPEIDGPHVRMDISDNGMGMSDEVRRRVFDPFYTTKSTDGTTAGGSGLGLTVAMQIVSRHGGHIDVHSVEGEGTTFSVSLPLPAVEDDPSRTQMIDIRREATPPAPGGTDQSARTR